VRLEPEPPGLLPPYDLECQFEVLRGLEPTPVHAPRALWFEGTGAVLGRPFYVMERLDGTVFERDVEPLRTDASRVRRMSESLVEELAAIHLVDLEATGLGRIGDGHGHLVRELDRWAGEVQRVQRAPIPVLDRLVDEVGTTMPEQCPRITLVHGDSKPGNFGFVGAEVSAVFDWELTTVGDPLTDIGWAETVWPFGFTGLPGSLTPDQFVALYQDLTGIEVVHREWYRAFQGLKMAVIMLVGSMLFDAGDSDDPRLAEMGSAVGFVGQAALAELGITEPLDASAAVPREERLATLEGG
jgi:aminoglycoside phosphotransferase (APT) family kinase protein